MTIHNESNDCANQEPATLVEATLVSEGSCSHGNQSDLPIVAEPMPLARWNTRHNRFFIGVFCCSLAGAFAIAFTCSRHLRNSVVHPVTMSKNFSTGTSPTALTRTLERITNEGVLRCGAMLSGTLGVDLCHAVAAAALGKDYKVEIVPIGGSSVYDTLSSGTVDLLTCFNAHTMQTEVYEGRYLQGFAFSRPYGYRSVFFTGQPDQIRCLDSHSLIHLIACPDAVFCVDDRLYQELNEILPGNQVHVIGNFSSVVDAFMEGKCNVVSAPGWKVRNQGYTKAILESNRSFVRDSLGMVTRNDDPGWTDFTNWVLQALVFAAKWNITQREASSSATTLLPETTLFGDQYSSMFRHAVASVGNYREVLSRSFLTRFPDLTVVDTLLSETYSGQIRGQHQSNTFGFVRSSVHGPGPGGRLQQVLERNILRCGVRPDRPGFADWDESLGEYVGIEVAYCAALACGIFAGLNGDVSIVNVVNETTASRLLADGLVDVVAGMEHNLERDVRDKTTGIGFSFSKPYFYGPYPSAGVPEENLCLMTKQDDPQWSSLVYWMVEAFIYAEENRITKVHAHDMPEVFLFGPDLSRIFRDAIFTIGNYGQLYDNYLESLIPREGRNQLTVPFVNGPTLIPLPGLG